ncbi:hypothetical protein JKP88DRAFT_318512 [Tribonema minus]|uniref:Uncharacterized protein n=1 Tax=Tribonema minus TaxID=303371 RepID=A0A835Z026_9STRA|nr:hypothetical protein JKP88DRAFT_318512 [Tribonema minus]
MPPGPKARGGSCSPTISPRSSTQVIEVGDLNGSEVDLDKEEASMTVRAEEFKRQGNAAQGNAAYAARDFAAAAAAYGAAIALRGGGARGAVYRANRAAAHAAAGDWAAAARDARCAVAHDASYVKGHYRLAQALLEEGGDADSAAAIAAAAAGLVVDPLCRELHMLMRRALDRASAQHQQQQQQAQRAASRSPPKAARQRDAAPPLPPPPPPSPPRPPSSPAAARSDDALLRMLCAGVDGAGHGLDGVFAQLLQKDAFQRIVFPGLSEEQRKWAPQTFRALLQDPAYSGGLKDAARKAQARAASVLEGVKKRGREGGEDMDAATDAALRPQILQEAFAREVVAMVREVHARAHAAAAEDPAQHASPDQDEATWDQLTLPAVEGLARMSGKAGGVAVVDGYLGGEWPKLVAGDCRRMLAAGRLGAGGGAEAMAWVEPAELAQAYPALHELVIALHALPFELNAKAPALALARALPGSTMVSRLPRGGDVGRRLDSVISGQRTGFKGQLQHESADRGCVEGAGSAAVAAFKITAIYFVGEDEWLPGMGGEVRLMHQAVVEPRKSAAADGDGGGDDSAPTVVEPRPDRLLLFRSEGVWNERAAVEAEDMWTVVFWLHGAAGSCCAEERAAETAATAG